jgi:Cell Wall Hydrolase
MKSNVGLLSKIGFAEFRGSGTIEQLVGMDITMNRVGVKGFASNLEGVIRQPLQYSSLNPGDPNKGYFDDPYTKMYIKGKLSMANHNAWTRTVENAASIYDGANRGISQGATLYYSPMSMRPSGSIPNWNFKVLTEVSVPGVNPNHIKLYKNK